MRPDLPSISLSRAKVIEIICYDLSYVKAYEVTLFFLTQKMSECVF